FQLSNSGTRAKRKPVRFALLTLRRAKRGSARGSCKRHHPSRLSEGGTYKRKALYNVAARRLRNLPTIINASPITMTKQEKNCPRVNPAISEASGSRKYPTTIRKTA